MVDGRILSGFGGQGFRVQLGLLAIQQGSSA